MYLVKFLQETSLTFHKNYECKEMLKKYHQFIKFSFVGILRSLLCIALFSFYQNFTTPIFANIVAIITVVFFGFILNIIFVFKEDIKLNLILNQIPIVFIYLIASSFLLKSFILIGLTASVAQILSVGFLFPFTFIATKYVFKK
jgi:putative flippase GtrA